MVKGEKMHEKIIQKLKSLEDYEAAEECRCRVDAIGMLIYRHNKFKKFVRNYLLILYQQLGWKRFFILDYWRLYLGINRK